MGKVPIWRCERCGIVTHMPGSLACERIRLQITEREVRAQLPPIIRSLPLRVLGWIARAVGAGERREHG